MDLSELKQLAQIGEELRQGREILECPVCERRQTQWVITYSKVQIRECKGHGKIHAHTLYYDATGTHLWAVEHRDGTVDWREKIDLDRTEGRTHWDRTWDNPRRKGGRKKGGSGWTEYANPEGKDDE